MLRPQRVQQPTPDQQEDDDARRDRGGGEQGDCQREPTGEQRCDYRSTRVDEDRPLNRRVAAELVGDCPCNLSFNHGPDPSPEARSTPPVAASVDAESALSAID